MNTKWKPSATLSGGVKTRLIKESGGSFSLAYQALRAVKKESGSQSLNPEDVVRRIRKLKSAS
jgi:hypothetical protein